MLTCILRLINTDGSPNTSFCLNHTQCNKEAAEGSMMSFPGDHIAAAWSSNHGWNNWNKVCWVL